MGGCSIHDFHCVSTIGDIYSISKLLQIDDLVGLVLVDAAVIGLKLMSLLKMRLVRNKLLCCYQ